MSSIVSQHKRTLCNFYAFYFGFVLLEFDALLSTYFFGVFLFVFFFFVLSFVFITYKKEPEVD